MVHVVQSKTGLVLSDNSEHVGVQAEWIGRLVALGARAARYIQAANSRQLVIAVSVPRRDFAAVLIGCGWLLASAKPELPLPLDTLRKLERGQWVRAVNKDKVRVGSFAWLDESGDTPKAHFAGMTCAVDKVRALSEIGEWEILDRDTCSQDRPEPGSMARMGGLDLIWDAWLARPAADLAIIGTKKWLENDLEACLTRENDEDLEHSSIRSLLMPKTTCAATWNTIILPAADLAESLPLPARLNAVILDGNRAIEYLPDVEAPVVICVLDRSRVEDTTEEVIIQWRNNRGEPISLKNDLMWTPPGGVEALGYTVAL
ncbi:hypothetical protein O3654_04680 [Pauljensenia sp. 20925_1_91]